MCTFWVEELVISPRVRTKIRESHGVSSHEVEKAVVRVQGLQAWEDEHPDHGFRWLVRVTVRSASYLVVLHPLDEPDVYALATAFPVQRGAR